MQNAFLSRLALLVLVVTAAATAQTPQDPWLILAGGQTGSIHAHTTRDDLVRLYGAANVVDQDIDVGEGETEAGTVVFPADPERTVEIIWKDQKQKTSPSSLTISGAASRWHGPRGISLGTSLKELEHLNGRPFSLAGFDWDYGGTVYSWHDGLIQDDFEGHGRVIVRLGYTTHSGVTDSELASVASDGDFSSHLPVMQKLNPRIYQMIWVFP